MKKLAVLVLAIVFNIPAFAGQWYPLGFDRESALFLDRSTASLNGSQRQVWVWVVYSKTQRAADNMKFLWVMDCQNRKVKLEHYSRYLGSKFVSSGEGDKVFEPVIPDSKGSQIWDIVCKNEFQEPYLDSVDVGEVQKVMKKSKGSPK